LRQRWNGATPAERQQMLQNMRERRLNRQGPRAMPQMQRRPPPGERRRRR